MRRLDIFVIVFAVIGAFLLSLFVKYQFTSPDAFSSTEKSINFELSDLYTATGSRSLIHDYCNDIVIISADKSNRQQIAATILALSKMGAKVIGVDLMFPTRQEHDNELIAAFRSCPQTILPYHLEQEEETNYYFISDSSYFYNVLEHQTYGADNLGGSTIRSTIRVFKPFFEFRERQNMDSFAAAAVHLYSPKSYDKLKNRNIKLERIRFHGIDLECLSWNEIITNDSIPQINWHNKELIEGKIVLIGHVNSNTDFHTTPIDVETPGVYIHAYTINTILKEAYIKQSSEVINYIIAILITLIFCIFVQYTKGHIKHIGELIIRVCQFLLMILFFIIGTLLYLKHSIFVNFSLCLLMIGFSMLMLDIAYGFYWLYLWLTKHFKRMNIKCIIIPICLFLGSGTLFAQNRLAIYSVSQGVTYKSTISQTWKNANKRLELSQEDSLRIPDKASISILDRYSSHTYYYTAKGNETISVTQIIKIAQNNDRGLIASLIQELISNSKIGHLAVSFKSRGVTTMSQIPIEKELCSYIDSYIQSKLQDKKELISSDLFLSKVFSNKLFTFEVTNNSDKGYYFNIVKIDNNGAHICYNIHSIEGKSINEISLYIRPNSKFTLPEYYFINEKGAEYIIIASEQEFSWNLLEEYLNDTDFNSEYYDRETYKIGITK